MMQWSYNVIASKLQCDWRKEFSRKLDENSWISLVSGREER